ncbi:glycosyltransferase family 4 protein [Amphibacillus sediminis]|uniref:glycosyltransferase family 4 protein n=1 Tax=Amphibacillus sediminis TaxID=360185 RepID=UPI0008313A6E|nr:glycosyltransferase family 4 protein [Amphibacillus sediminis]
MRVGIFTDTYYPQVNGVATSTFMLKDSLERLGHEVYVFTTSDKLVKKDEGNVFRVPSIPVLSERRLAMFYQPHLAKLIKGLNLDIIHTHTEFSLGIFGRSMAKKLNIPLIHTYHTIYEDYTHYIIKLSKLDPLAKRAARKMSSSFCGSANRLIVPTQKVKDLLLSYGVERDISVIPTGIKLDKFSNFNYSSKQTKALRSSLGVEENDKVILYIGRLSKEKNIEELLMNLHLYLHKKEDLKFVLIGDGPAKNELMALANQLCIENQVIFAGEKPWESISDYYQIGDVFVSASQSETQGITYIEALASGLPVLAKSDPCLKGVVQNELNGYNFHNKIDFLQALDIILYNEQQKKKLSLGAIQSVEKFSVNHYARNVENVYSKCISVPHYKQMII